MKLVHALVTTALLFGGRSALADDLADPYADAPVVQPAPQGPMRPMRGNGELRRALIDRFDRNHDGRLEPNERRHAIRALRKLERKLARQERRADRASHGAADRRDAKLRGVIRRYDLNGDGDVGPGEMPPAMANRLRRYDRDGNGWVDDADFDRGPGPR